MLHSKYKVDVCYVLLNVRLSSTLFQAYYTSGWTLV